MVDGPAALPSALRASNRDVRGIRIGAPARGRLRIRRPCTSEAAQSVGGSLPFGGGAPFPPTAFRPNHDPDQVRTRVGSRCAANGRSYRLGVSSMKIP